MSPVVFGSGYPSTWQRAELTDALLATLGQRFRIGSILDAQDLGGVVNLNIKLETSDRPLVARVHRGWMTRGRLAWQRNATVAVARRGIPVPQSVGPVVTVGGRLTELEEFIENDSGPIGFEEISRSWSLLGQLHFALADLPASRPRESAWCPPPRLNRWIAAGLESARDVEARDIAARASAVAAQLRRWWPSDARALPWTTVHGDYHGKNILFRAGQIVGILDFGFCAVRPRVFELGYSWLNAHLGFGRTRAIESARLAELLDAFDAHAQPMLTDLERASLPEATALASLYWVAEAYRMADVDASIRNEREFVDLAERLMGQRRARSRT